MTPFEQGTPPLAGRLAKGIATGAGAAGIVAVLTPASRLASEFGGVTRFVGTALVVGSVAGALVALSLPVLRRSLAIAAAIGAMLGTIMGAVVWLAAGTEPADVHSFVPFAFTGFLMGGVAGWLLFDSIGRDR